jgi:hypothetical protein
MQLLIERFLRYGRKVWNLLEEIGSHLMEGHAKICSSEETKQDNVHVSSDVLSLPKSEIKINYVVKSQQFNDYM